MKKILPGLLLIILIGLLAACGSNTEASGSSSDTLSSKHLVVGVTGGPHKVVMEKVKELAAKQGLEIEIQTFSDYVIPNTALAQGNLDLNSYQHIPFMKQYNQSHDTHLKAVIPTILFPMGVYSKKISSLKELQKGARIGLPSDPTNGARALAIFEEAGLIKIPDDIQMSATIHDIAKNPKNLQFIPLKAAEIPNQLGSLAAAAINTNYAVSAGLDPQKDSIYQESTDSPYTNYIVVRKENKDDPVLDTLADLYHSKAVKQLIQKKYHGSIIPAW